MKKILTMLSLLVLALSISLPAAALEGSQTAARFCSRLADLPSFHWLKPEDPHQ